MLTSKAMVRCWVALQVLRYLIEDCSARYDSIHRIRLLVILLYRIDIHALCKRVEYSGYLHSAWQNDRVQLTGESCSGQWSPEQLENMNVTLGKNILQLMPIRRPI